MKNWINSDNNIDSIVLSSKVTLSRNIDKKLFVNKLNFLEARETGKLIHDILTKEMKDEDFSLFEMWNQSEDNFKKYIEQGLITEKLVKNSNKASFILNKDRTVSVMINEDNHIEIQCITGGLDLMEALNCAFAIDDIIEKNVTYAFDEKLGYLSPLISDVGTGLKASVIIHLPTLTMNDEINNLAPDLKKLGVNINGLYYKDKKVTGSLYSISNDNILGISEEDIIGKVKDAVLSLVSEEKKYREILLGKCEYELEDKIFRSYGIIKNAVLLDFNEMLDLLSNIRLGVELSIIDIEKAKLNEIQVCTGDFSLQNVLNSNLDSKQIKYERCKLIKGILV